MFADHFHGGKDFLKWLKTKNDIKNGVQTGNSLVTPFLLLNEAFNIFLEKSPFL